MQPTSIGEGLFHFKASNVIGRFIFASLGVLVLGWLGYLLSPSGNSPPIFWLISGFSIAVLYRWGIRYWPALFAGALLLHFFSSVSILYALSAAVANSMGYVLAAYWIGNPQVKSVSTHALRIIGIGATAVISSALIGGSVMSLFHVGKLEAIENSLSWWMTETIGIFLLAPACCTLKQAHLNHLTQSILSFVSATLVCVTACFIYFHINANTDLVLTTAAAFVSLLITAWFALKFGLIGSSVSSIIFILTAMLTRENALINSTATTTPTLEIIWLYAGCLSLFGILVSSAHAQVEQINRQLGQTTEEQLKQQRQLEAVLHAIPDLLFEIDRQGHVISYNTRGKNDVDHPELLGNNLSESLSVNSLSIWLAAIEEADNWGLSQGRSIHLDHKGTSYWFELSIAKRPAARREDDHFVCLARDISKRVAIHQNDLANEQRFRNIFEATRNIAVQGYNRFHEVIFWNKASEELYGFSASEAMGKKLEHLIIPQELREKVHQSIEYWHEHNAPIPSGELALQAKDGNEVWVYSNHVLIDTPNLKEMYCLDIDLGPQRRALDRAEKELAERKIIETALREREQQLYNAQIMARIAHWSWSPRDDVFSVSESLYKIFSLTESTTLFGFHDFNHQYVHPEDQALFELALHQCFITGKNIAIDIRLNVNEQHFWLHVQGDRASDDGLIQGTLQDITERKGLDIALAAAAADAASTSNFFVSILSALTTAIRAQHAFISLVDPDHPENATTHTYLKNNERQSNFCYPLINAPCSEVISHHFCYAPSNAQGEFPDNPFISHENIESYLGVSIRDNAGRAIGILMVMSEQSMVCSAQLRSLLLIFSDRISGELQRARDQEQIHNLAFFDPLTRLPNRRLLIDQLRAMAVQSARHNQYCALLFIDIDHFKLLNDTRGHHVGDQLLVLIAERIAQIVQPGDVSARLGGDEFIVALTDLGCHREEAEPLAQHRAEELHNLLSLPYALSHSIYHCALSIGVNLFKGDQHSIDDLLRHADVAMYQAKDSGRNAIRFFDPMMQSRLELRAATESDLRVAYESNDQLMPYYQIQVNKQGDPIGAELLLRWKHPKKGFISPATFIPIAEKTGLIVHIGRYVIRQACAQLQKWAAHVDFKHLSIAVNVSPIQFNQPYFVEDIQQIVALYQINPQLLKLELTESSLLKNVDQSILKMQQLRELGIGFSMDDFGTGYSSLSYLKRLPLGQLKIDQAFVRDIATDHSDAVIVRTIISMAQHMNLQVIAEGVETDEQRQFLERNGCAFFQGYLFGKPAPIDEFEVQLREKMSRELSY